MINIISIWFIIFAAVTICFYFLCPMKYRWLILLVASVFFYAFTGLESCLFLLLAANIAYMATRIMEDIYNGDNPDKKKARACLITGIACVLLLLVYSKAGTAIAKSVASIFSMQPLDWREIVPLGISYYTFSIIGYMTDVYRKRQIAEHNFLKFFLYVSYFPQILQGPIPRYRTLAPQLLEGHKFNYKHLCYGMQRMVWGYFKKMVIADRFALLTGEVFGNYESYEGLVFVVAAIFGAVQLYCDFSGCIDIVLGFSETMSIYLDENFRRPFYSKSASEFWHRWHITLGTWFKDYVYMPIVGSHALFRLCQKSKKVFGKRFAKGLMTAVPLAVVWILTGLWHGTGADYNLWGCYWGTIIISSTLLASEYKKLRKKCNIDTSSRLYQSFQILRTGCIYVFSRLIVMPENLRASGEIIRRMFQKFNVWVFFDETLYSIGLDRKDFWVGILAVLLLWKVSSMQEKGVKIRDKIASLPLPLRWAVYYAGILSILIFGIYGSKQAGSGFIYMNY